MAINILNVSQLQSALQKMWQQQLGTSEDPANGQWYTNGANGDAIGLYGDLTDTAPTQLDFNRGAQLYLPSQLICGTSTVDNREGLNTNASMTLTHSYSDSTNYTQTATNSISNTDSVSFGVSATFEGLGGKAGKSMSTTFDYSMANSSGGSQTQTQTFSQTVAVNPPQGKVYQAVLTATVQKLVVPYTCAIQVSGWTETWFEDRINGHFRWMMPAAEAFALINQYAAAGSDSALYGASGGVGTVTVSGTLTAQQTVNFVVQIFDITAHYTGNNQPPLSSAAAASSDQTPFLSAIQRVTEPDAMPVEGTLVRTINF